MAFGRIGDVRDVYIPRDFHSQQPKGFAFIEYATPEMAREARDEMDKFLMKGRELEVVYAQEKRKSPGEMRGRVVDGSGSRDGGSRDNRGRRGGGGGGDDSFQRYVCVACLSIFGVQDVYAHTLFIFTLNTNADHLRLSVTSAGSASVKTISDLRMLNAMKAIVVTEFSIDTLGKYGAG